MKQQFRLTDSDNIKQLKDEIRDIKNKYPFFYAFLKDYCGFYTPCLTADPHELAYSGGKRDVILTIETIAREDITAEQIAENFK